MQDSELSVALGAVLAERKGWEPRWQRRYGLSQSLTETLSSHLVLSLHDSMPS